MKLYIVKFLTDESSGRMEKVLDKALHTIASCTELKEKGLQLRPQVIQSPEEFFVAAENGLLQNQRILFAVELDKGGINLDAYRLIAYLNSSSHKEALKKSVGGVIVDGQGSLFTKDIGRRIVFGANMAGCSFPGKPLAEASSDLSNFKVLSNLWQLSVLETYTKVCTSVMKKILGFTFETNEIPNILAIHASNHKTSNSLLLWNMIKEHLGDNAEIEDVSIRNGQIQDCRGCRYEECLHFGENDTCFYGGVIVEKVYPAIVKSDILMLICPNYNDSVSANIMAFINRLTAVFRAKDLSHKKIYALVVSGYSGGDIVAQQIIGALNMNKTLILPGNFALLETANNPGDIMAVTDIEKRAKAFAEKILNA